MKVFLISLFLCFQSCAWIVAHPEVEVEAAKLGIEALKEIYEYESKTLSPAAPQPNEIKPMQQVFKP